MPKQNLGFRIFQNAGLVVISLGLIYGGVQIIKLELPFWSLFYGLAAIGIGVAMSLVAFNEVAKSRSATVNEYHEIPCSNCSKMTLVPYLTEKTVCSDCQLKYIRRVQTGLLVFLILMLPAMFHLTQLAQDISQKAKILQTTPICESGSWQPAVCRCGFWDAQIACDDFEQGRNCRETAYCCNKLNNSWNCRLAD